MIRRLLLIGYLRLCRISILLIYTESNTIVKCWHVIYQAGFDNGGMNGKHEYNIYAGFKGSFSPD